MSFVILHTYSGFSYLQSGLVATKIPALARKNGYDYIGLCDNGTLSGYAPFTHACLTLGMKPVYGMDAVVPEGCFSLFIKNEEGYRNLLKLTLLASESKLTLADIQSSGKGLIAIFSADNSIFKQKIGRDEKSLALTLSSYLKGFDSIYLGIPFLPNDASFIEGVRNFCSSHSYETVAFPKISYEKKNDAIVIAITSAIQNHENLNEKVKEGNEYFLSDEEAIKYFSSQERDNTEKIAKSSDFVFIKKRGTLLHFDNPDSVSSEDYLKKLTFEGLKRRQPTLPKEYIDRVNYELGIINKMGYADYFLIVQDYVNWAKNNGVSVGPGRGSGAGSLVSYCLGIVEADPIRFGLLFERFLNPERQSMPDIDVDFSDINRDKVVVYLQHKYGSERVGHVLTTQTIGAKEALRDIGRVYQYEDREINLVISTIVDDSLSLRDDYRKTLQFRRLIDSDKYYLQMVALASKIEGLPRQAGLHAAGIVLNNEPLPAVLPVSENESVGYVACLEKDYLEEQGFLKMDILGLRNLTIIDTCLALIEHFEGKKLTYADLPFEDDKAIALIRENKTMGLFQLESPGMKRAIREIMPTSFEDVAALLALFRPGPMGSLPSYARRKAGYEKVTYLSPELEPILKKTYGIIVYQEQIMQIVRVMAGFSYGEADLFRRAISKKNAEKLAALKDKFINGCLANGKDKTVAEKVYSLIYKFADYGFNRSHAVSYAVLTCQMAYLKSRFPKEFYCSILDSMSPSDTKFKNTISEIKTLGLRLAIPDINRSGTGFLIDDDKIRFPLSAIKGVQSNLINALIDERNAAGPFADLFDFAARMRRHSLTLPTLIKFIDAGALDSLYPSRASLRATAAAAMRYAEMMYGETGQDILLSLGIEKPAMVKANDDIKTNLSSEYEMLGMMVSGSPLSLYATKLKELHITPLGELETSNGEVETAGIIKSVKVITTRKGQQMAFLELYDDVNEANFILFSEAYATYYDIVKVDAIVIVKCRKDERKEGSFIVSSVTKLGE